MQTFSDALLSKVAEQGILVMILVFIIIGLLFIIKFIATKYLSRLEKDADLKIEVTSLRESIDDLSNKIDSNGIDTSHAEVIKLELRKMRILVSKKLEYNEDDNDHRGAPDNENHP